MKTFLLLSFVLFSFTSSAQIVSIPDANFKDALLNHNPVIDINADGEIQESEALATHYLSISGGGVSDLTGIQSFANLDSFYFSANTITTANLSGMVHLTVLYLNSNNLTSVNLNNCPALNTLYLEYNQLTSIDLSGVPNIVDLVIDHNALTGVDFSGLNSVRSIDCSINNITSLTIDNLPALMVLQCNQNALTALNLSNCPNLGLIDCFNNQLTTIDASNLSNLSILDCSQNPLLQSINVKNEIETGINVTGDVLLQYVCADDEEITSIQNAVASIPGVSINTYCSISSTGFYNTIYGTASVDENSNGCDAADPVFPHLKVTIDDGTQAGHTQTLNTGDYTIYAGAGNFTITPETFNPYYSISPASTSVNFTNPCCDYNAINFCVVPNGNHQDVGVVLIPLNAARPGFISACKIIYTNNGTMPVLSGNVALNFNDTNLDFSNATPAVTTQNPGSLNWSFSNLLPLESRSIIVTLQVLAPPLNNIGDLINYTASITPLAGDENPVDNTVKLEQTVSGSADPNDKTCLEGKFIDVTKIGEYVHYVIRFQNTGTDTAFSVVIEDILSDKYDWNSLRLIDASHPCVLKQSQGNKLAFMFENINLPAQSVNDDGSQGYVAFQIKPVNTIAFRDSLINSASIYFDFNLPVVTDNAITIVDSLNVVPVNFEYFKGQKQETKNILTWKTNCNSTSTVFEIERSSNKRNFTVIGNITASNTRCQQPFDFIDNNPINGINYYRIKMIAADGKIIYSAVIALFNKHTGFEIISLAPNPVTGKTSFLNIISTQSQQINTRITDIMGRSVYNKSQPIPAGSTQIELNLANLSKGVYTIILNSGEGDVKKLRFVKE